MDHDGEGEAAALADGLAAADALGLGAVDAGALAEGLGLGVEPLLQAATPTAARSSAVARTRRWSMRSSELARRSSRWVRRRSPTKAGCARPLSAF
jgi:hypothetical protein